VRIFSFYPPQGRNIAEHRTAVIDRLKQMYDYVEDRNVQLVLENETGIYGDTPQRCVDLLDELRPDPTQLVMAFDPGNFVAVGALPVYETCWKPLRKYVGYFHMKDRKMGAKAPCVPCGQGDGDVQKILTDAVQSGQDQDSILALEPHLKAAGQFAGTTGPELFKVAADALKQVCQAVGLPLKGGSARGA
jgi:sugar phosphate isomerase/epimerase